MTRRKFLSALSVGIMYQRQSSSKPPAQTDGFITDVEGIKVGHFTESRRPTGCTVILYERGAVAGVDVRGSAPGTRETDLLKPTNLVDKVNAIVLSGGSAFGLESAGGVMRYLEEHDAGYATAAGKVPPSHSRGGWQGVRPAGLGLRAEAVAGERPAAADYGRPGFRRC